VLDKVRKLLAKAEDPACTPAEAEALTAKATELIAKYGIDLAVLAAQRPEPHRIGDRRIALDAPYAREKAHLLHVIARSMRCQGVNLGDRIVHLFGVEDDLRCVELVFASLLVQAARALAAERVPAHAHAAAWRRSWYVGFAQAVGGRFQEADLRTRLNEPAAARPGLELVLADRATAVEQAISDQYPQLVSGRRRRLTGNGFASGRAAGHRADLGDPRIDAAAAARHLGR
jgi:hypothetical protein